MNPEKSDLQIPKHIHTNLHSMTVANQLPEGTPDELSPNHPFSGSLIMIIISLYYLFPAAFFNINLFQSP